MPLLIREARPNDAARLIDYMNNLIDEPVTSLEMSKGEFDLTLEEETEFLDRCSKSENSIFLIAENDHKILGTVLCIGSNRIKVRHNTVLGITVDKNFRDKGIGSQLMEQAIKWAKDTGVIERIELQVFKNNDRAIHLYKKYGFIIEGEKQKAIKINGEYVNEYIMTLTI